MFTSTADVTTFENEEFTENRDAGERAGLSNEAIAKGLEEISRLLGREPRNQARRLALAHAAGAIRGCGHPVKRLVDDDSIEGVHRLGIDYELSGVITDWVRSGRLPWLERLRSQRREELLELPGIGPKLSQELRDVLGVVDLDGLAQVARDGRLSSMCGFGAKRLKLISGLLAARGLAVELGR